MGVTEVATSVTESLKSQPLALALVIINVLYLAGGGWLLVEVSKRSQHRDDLIIQLAQRECIPTKKE